MIITLVEPQIPPNTGNIARLCAATGTRLELVGKIGFDLDDRYLKRAGLDYWKHVEWKYYEDLESFMEKLDHNQVHLFTTKAEKSYFKSKFKTNDRLVFGSELKGLDEKYLEIFKDKCCTIPMINQVKGVRSLNLSSCAAIALYEAIRQQG